MSMHPNPASVLLRGVALALVMLFSVGTAAAQNKSVGTGAAQDKEVAGSNESASPFAPLAGNWSGSGTIDLSNGRHEPIKCRASYDVLDEQDKLQLNIQCASESYQFHLRGSATYTGGTIRGNWSESTRNAAGTLSGTVEGAGFEVVANGPSFTANLSLATRGEKQSVTIKSRDSDANVRGATITMQRG